MISIDLPIRLKNKMCYIESSSKMLQNVESMCDFSLSVSHFVLFYLAEILYEWRNKEYLNINYSEDFLKKHIQIVFP